MKTKPKLISDAMLKRGKPPKQGKSNKTKPGKPSVLRDTLAGWI